MFNSIETADVFLNILYDKSCFLCYKMSSNMTNVAEVLEIHDSNSNKVLDLSEIVHYLFPSLNIMCSQACRNCSDLLTRMYIIMIKNRFITNIVNSVTDKFNTCIKESNAENGLIVNLTILSKEDNNQINTDSTNTVEVNTQITNVIESRCIEEPQCTKKSLYQNHTKKRKKKYYNCHDCSYRSLCKGTLEGHINKHHIKARPFVCHICCKSFYTKSNLTEHAQTHNKVGEICDVCGDIFGRRRSLVDHLRLHSNDRQYKCDLCDKYFVNSGRRLDHIKRNHMEKTECCVFCDKKFGMKKELIRHVKSVHT